jgi:hypothetical protein
MGEYFMESVLCDSYCDSYAVKVRQRAEAGTSSSGRDSALRAAAAAVLAHAAPPRVVWERRCELRLPYNRPILITLATEDGVFLAQNSLVAIGKNLSSAGIAFLTSELIAARHVIAWLEGPQQQLFGFQTTLRWCRAVGLGWYENGGCFLELWRDGGVLEQAIRQRMRQRLSGHGDLSNFSIASSS